MFEVGQLVLVDGRWFAVEEIDGETAWVSDDSGEVYEKKVSELSV